ncbi:hypothetical protein L5515_017325 [Caenorhabditis briggsae]|uniref:Uncharacterized protein n=1 Tax=Caenorhabditis briggsae TaxID=6238 RepID=A0AAE9JQP6_CAEBR|nr:hypothetical protein L5515_017325 [Caenorhabditis briggsae]
MSIRKTILCRRIDASRKRKNFSLYQPSSMCFKTGESHHDLFMTVSLAVANEDYSIEALKNETSTEKVIILYNGTFTCANTPFCAMATYHRATRDNL